MEALALSFNQLKVHMLFALAQL